jgi:hypothetical protein
MELSEFLLERIAEDEQSARDPRAVQDCEVKRRIIRLQQSTLDHAWQDGAMQGVIEYPAKRTLTYLALPYADHPDYQQEWSC